jgi:hypothetical protein
MSVSNRQPDIVGISFTKRNIAIDPEVMIPSDSRRPALTEAYDRKIKSYKPQTAALQSYIDSGWDVCVLPYEWRSTATYAITTTWMSIFRGKPCYVCVRL